MKRVFDAAVIRQGVCLLLAMAVSILIQADRSEAGLVVSNLYLVNQVAVFADHDILGSESTIAPLIPTPFITTRFNSVENSTSSSTYSFDWSGDTGTFRVDGAHTAIHPSADLVQTKSSGNMDFTPMVDSLVSIHVRYNYSLPDAFMDVQASGAVYDDQARQTYIDLYTYEFSFGPTSGSFDQTMTAVVPAGCNCSFGFTMRLITEATSVAATDNGTVELSIVPLPEPAAILPLALGAMIGHRRMPRFHPRTSLD